MQGWVGPAVALSLIVIAATYLVIGIVVLLAAKKAMDQAKALGKEFAHLRTDLAPTLYAVNRLSEKGLDLAVIAEAEVKDIIATTRRIRTDIEDGVERVKSRLAAFEETDETVHEEIDSTIATVSTVLTTARAGAGNEQREGKSQQQTECCCDG